MKTNIWTFIYFVVAIPFLTRFFGFSSSGNPSYLITGSMGILMLVLIFSSYKNFYILLFITLGGLILVSGSLLTYIFLIKPNYISNEYYYAIGTLIIYVFALTYSYLHRMDITPI